MEIKKVVFIKQVELKAWDVASLALVLVVCKERIGDRLKDRKCFLNLRNSLFIFSFLLVHHEVPACIDD